MSIKNATDVIAVAKSRGFSIRINAGPPPIPVLVLPAGHSDSLKSEATDALLGALRAWRLEIIEELSVENPT